MKCGLSPLLVPILFLLIVLTPICVLTKLQMPFAAPSALLTSVMILWVTGLIPVAATAILIPCLAIVFGILSPAAAFLPFGSSILGLFVGVFLLVRAVQKFGLDQRIAFFVLRNKFAVRSPSRLVMLTACCAWLLGMWMSNTATCALLLPVCLGILDWSKDHLSPAQFRVFSTRLLLTCAYTPSIGGMATPVGSVPNALAIEHLAKQGLKVSFFDWFLMAFPLSATLLVASLVVLHILFPLRYCAFKNSSHEKQYIQEHRIHHRLLFAVLGIVILLWLAPEIIAVIWPDHTHLADRIPLAIPAIIGALSLFVFRVNDAPLLETKDLSRIDWSTILLFGGGLCLGEVLNASGTAPALARTLIDQSQGEVTWMPLLISITSTVLSEVSSNTATASIMVPILSNLLQWMPADQSFVLIISSVFAAGLGFMLPISTPPNAMIFGTGKIKLSDMILAGVILDIVGIAAITAYGLMRL